MYISFIFKILLVIYVYNYEEVMVFRKEKIENVLLWLVMIIMLI